jgi:vacuolar protein sorting-associated protein 72
MTDNEGLDIPMSDAVPRESPPPTEDDGEASSSENEEVVPMVVARTRRANAGSRMGQLLRLAGEEDNQNLEAYGEIFQEAADDVEFQADDDQDADVNMESSSEEEEDEGAQDDMQGEKELKAAERKSGSHKRKRAVLLDSAMKRATARQLPHIAKASPGSVAGSTSDGAAIRPRKKSERVSWLPEEEEGPKRASSRHLSVQNKEMVHSRLKEKEKHRLRTVAIMKAAEMRKEARKPKVLTQAQRLQEAAATEKANSKSLHKWETAEKKREEEQAARLAALKNRKLEGPIISYWSGPSLWINGKLKGTGKAVLGEPVLVEEIAKEVGPKTEVVDEVVAETTPMEIPGQTTESVVESVALPAIQTSAPPSTTDTPSPVVSLAIPTDIAKSEPLTSNPPLSNGVSNTMDLDVVQPPTPLQTTPLANGDSNTAKPDEVQPLMPVQAAPLSNSEPQQATSAPSQDPASFMDELHFYANLPPEEQKSTIPPPPQPTVTVAPTVPVVPRKQTREVAARTLIELRAFSPDLKPRDKDAFLHHLCDWPPMPPKKLVPAKKILCVITGQTAKYCDPVTGLAYADSCALKGIRRVMGGGSRWSTLLGGYTGPRYGEVINKNIVFGRPAQGVPEGFWKKTAAPAEAKVEASG